MKALVLGKGKSGTAAASVLRSDGFAVDFADGYDVVIASPGLQVKSELQLGCERLRSRGVKLLAVTGSKGKSSVVKLLAEALGGVPCGNYGLPVCEVGDCEWAVVEVSSFQLETTNLPPDAFDAAAILNLQEDHIDRHGSIGAYHSLKRRLLSMSQKCICGDEIGEVDAMDVALMAGSYFDNPILRTNGAVAIWLLRTVGLSDASIRAAFAAFRPLPHRMNEVGVFDGVRYVDDSKATSIAALVAGVRMCNGPVRLIAGGLPKGDDPKIANAYLTKLVKKVYLIGESAKAFSSAWSGVVDCEIDGDMKSAVESARREAVSGDFVLLSPGAASFDQFTSFGERGDVFADLVKKGKKE